MSTQIRNKQPRPLSIIDESTSDDCPANDILVNVSSHSSNEQALEICERKKSIRRLAVAPLQHPVVEITQKHVQAANNNIILQKNPNMDIISSDINANLNKNNVKTVDFTASALINSIQNEEMLHKTVLVNEQQETNNEYNHITDSLTKSQTSFPKNLDKDTHRLLINESGPNSSRIYVNSMTNFGSVRNRMTKIDKKSEENQQRKQPFHVKDKLHEAKMKRERQHAIITKSVIASNTSLDTQQSKDIEDTNKTEYVNREYQERKVENEHIDKEQQVWKNRVRKSSSFTLTSSKTQSLRKSLGSYDYKSSPSLLQYRQRYLKAEDNELQQNVGINKVLFYLSSEPNEEQHHENVITVPTIPHATNGESHLSDSYLHPTNQNTLSNSENQSNTFTDRQISTIDQSEFSLLKTTANRLNLSTRRPSTQIWKAKYLDNEVFQKQWNRIHDPKDDHSEKYDEIKGSKTSFLAVEEINRINDSLTWLRQELIGIRLHDQTLANQFLSIRHTMNSLRLVAECKGHMQLLDQAKEDVEELRELSGLVDIPQELLSPLASLQHVGLTKMNLSSRRFSTC